MNKDIIEWVENCNTCIVNSRIKHYPLRTSELPEEPWSVVGADLFEYKGKDYLLVVDYFSRWIEVLEVHKKTTDAVVRGMEVIMARLGVPLTMRSDNGPCFSSDAFRRFIEEWKINHITSSPHYPESNGLAERSVGTVKRMWKKEENKNVALMVYRSTPLGGGKSPAELLYGRNLRTNLPRGTNEKTLEEFKEKDQKLKGYQKEYTDKRRRAKRRASLARGDQVWVKTAEDEEGKKGTIEEKTKEPESYLVRIGDKIYRRNRKHLRKLNIEPEKSRNQNTHQRGLEEGGHESETSSAESGQGDTASKGDDSTSDEEATAGEEVPRRSTRVRNNRHLRQDYVYY